MVHNSSCARSLDAEIPLHETAANTDPTSGPTTIIQKSGHAFGANSAGPNDRAGFTEQLLTGMPMILTNPRAKPIAAPAAEAFPNFDVAPRTTNTKKKVSSISDKRAICQVAPGWSTLVARYDTSPVNPIP